jgi:hypothetical protein
VFRGVHFLLLLFVVVRIVDCAEIMTAGDWIKPICI